MHVLDFLEVVENDSCEIENCTEDEHVEAFCREDFEEVLCYKKYGEAGQDVECDIQFVEHVSGNCVEENSDENKAPNDAKENPTGLSLNLCDCVGTVAESDDEERQNM